MYSIYQDGGHYDDVVGLKKAAALAEELLGGVMSGESATFTVEDELGGVCAFATNRRIEGVFTKQVWGGRKGDDAIFVEEESFDATDAVLAMDRAELVALEDGDASSDELGQRFVSWNGPCDVRIVEPICEYFGVSSLEEISEALLQYARKRAGLALPVAEGLADSADANPSLAAAQQAIEAHAKALGIEGDASIQVWHLLVSVRDYCVANNLDFDEEVRSASEESASRERAAPAAKPRTPGL